MGQMSLIDENRKTVRDVMYESVHNATREFKKSRQLIQPHRPERM